MALLDELTEFPRGAPDGMTFLGYAWYDGRSEEEQRYLSFWERYNAHKKEWAKNLGWETPDWDIRATSLYDFLQEPDSIGNLSEEHDDLMPVGRTPDGKYWYRSLWGAWAVLDREPGEIRESRELSPSSLAAMENLHQQIAARRWDVFAQWRGWKGPNPHRG